MSQNPSSPHAAGLVPYCKSQIYQFNETNALHAIQFVSLQSNNPYFSLKTKCNKKFKQTLIYISIF